MGLLDGTTQNAYYTGDTFGGYQFVSLDDIINQFIVAYVGEEKIINKVSRVDVAFHAQRGLQELSYDTFKSIKAYEIELPPSLMMKLPHDYVNYVKLSWSDTSGIEHIIYPTSKTSNPIQIHQDTSTSALEYFTVTGEMLTNGTFDSGLDGWSQGNNNGYFSNSGGTTFAATPQVAQMLHHATVATNLLQEPKMIPQQLYQEIDVSGINSITFSGERKPFSNSATTGGSSTVTLGIGTEIEMVPKYTSVNIGTNTAPSFEAQAAGSYPRVKQTGYFNASSYNNHAHRLPPKDTVFQNVTYPTADSTHQTDVAENVVISTAILPAQTLTTDKLDGYVEWAAEELGVKTGVTDVSAYDTVYLVVTLDDGVRSDLILAGSSGDGRCRMDNFSILNTLEVDLDMSIVNVGDLRLIPQSDTWDSYSGATPSENQDDDYRDDTYWPSLGERYGLDPIHAQVNGSYFIDNLKGNIHFSSNIAGKTITLKYISDSLGTDEEMQVHKFAEEAMYKHIAYSILSTKINIPEYVVQRFRKEKFATKRLAKLRLSNLKIEELTQTLRGKSKQIKH